MNLARRVTSLAESATLAVTARAAKMRAEGVDVIGFGAGEPDFDTPAHIKRAGIAAIEAGHTGYSKPASGIPIAKKAVCTKLSRDNKLQYTPEQVIVTAGGKMACYLAIQALVDPGDEVIIPRPYWVSYPEMVRLAGGVPVYVVGEAESDYKLTPERLKAAVNGRTRLFIFNSPSNPSGVTYHPAEVRALADALEDFDVWVVSDEIYDRFLFDGQERLSFAAAREWTYERTVTVNAPSKTYAMTGWRVGYAAGPGPVISAMAKLQSQTTSGAATFNQHALAAALTAEQDAVESMRVEFQRRSHHMYGRLMKMPNIRCPRPTGAFFCFPDVSATYRKLDVSGSVEFSNRLVEEAGVAVVPGIAFGLDGHVRLSFAASMEQIDAGLDRIEAWLGRYGTPDR